MSDFEVNSATLTVPDEAECVEVPPMDPANCGGCPPNVGPGGSSARTPAAAVGGAVMAGAAVAKYGKGGRGGAGGGSGPGSPTCSIAPIRYASGEIVLDVSDLDVSGFGIPWGHTRSFANRTTASHNWGNGYNWLVAEWTYLSIQPDEGTVAVMGVSTQTLWFDSVGSEYVPRFSVRQTLQFDPVDNLYRLYDLDGGVTEYSGVNGMLTRRLDAAGNSLSVISTTSNGLNLEEVQRTTTVNGNTTTESFLYTYDSSSTDSPLLQTATLRRKVGTGDWANVKKADYSYYVDGSDFGAGGDLQTAVTSVWDDGAWVATGTTYYRYDPADSVSSSSSSSSSSSGGGTSATHLLRYVLDPAAYDRLASDPGVTNPLIAPNSTVALYADYYFEYDSQRRVTMETVKGGSQTFLFSVSQSGFADDYNAWKTRVVETLPDGNQNSIYSNYAGQTMLKVFQSGDDQWNSFYRYSTDGKILLTAEPSAVSGYDEGYADLLNFDSETGTFQYLRDDEGLVHTYTYHAPTGWVASVALQQGQLGTSIPQLTLEYSPCCPSDSSSSSSSSSSGSAIPTPPCQYFLASETVYPTESDPDQQIVTSYSQSFYPGTCALQEQVTTLPVISTDQNGSGVAATRREYFDIYGNLTWLMDERGFITRMAYDIPTGAITQQVADVDTTLYSDEPPGWSTPSGGGLNLVTDFEHDDQGRITQTLGPSHTVDLNGSATTVRTASWTVYDDVNHVTLVAQGYATGTAPSYTYTLMNPVSITKMDASGQMNEQIQATAPSTTGTLADIIDDAGGVAAAFPQTSYVRWTTMQYTDCCLAASQRIYHTIPNSGSGSPGTNYDETDYGYNVMKRRNRTVTPGGTITDLVYDPRGLVLATYVGTNDDGATETDPTGGEADPDNDMVLVTANVYDGGTDGGDGNLTEGTQQVDATTTRVTSMTHDFRDRRVTTDGEVDYFEMSYYDNLDRVVKSERYDTTSTGNLIDRRETKFDDRGRAYQTIRYAVDPATGTVGNSLTDNTWFDASENVIKSLPAGSQLFTKTEYDSLNRPQTRYTGYDLDETGYPG